MVKSGSRSKRGLAASPSHLMHRALQLALDIYAEEAGPDGLTQRQFAVLEAASHKAGLTQTDLVRATGIDRSTLADLVARMTAKGLLRLSDLAGAADAAPDMAKAELKAAKKAAREAKKAGRLARKADGPAKPKRLEPA